MSHELTKKHKLHQCEIIPLPVETLLGNAGFHGKPLGSFPPQPGPFHLSSYARALGTRMQAGKSNHSGVEPAYMQ